MHAREAPAVRTERVRRRVRELLTGRFFLRAHMSLVVALSSGAAFVASRAARAVGLDAMGPRYALACFVAWGAFLGLFRLWLGYYHDRLAADLRPDTEALASTLSPPRETAAAHARAAGGGSSSHVHQAGDAAVFVGDVAQAAGGHGTVGESASEVAGAVGASGDAGDASSAASGLGGVDGDGAVVLVVVALVCLALAVFGVAAWLVWEAPVLFAEAAFDVVIAGVLARSSRRVDAQSWSSRVVRATAVPFVVVLTVSTVAGFVAQWACPVATTMGEAVQRCVVGRE